MAACTWVYICIHSLLFFFSRALPSHPAVEFILLGALEVVVLVDGAKYWNCHQFLLDYDSMIDRYLYFPSLDSIYQFDIFSSLKWAVGGLWWSKRQKSKQDWLDGQHPFHDPERWTCTLRLPKVRLLHRTAGRFLAEQYPHSGPTDEHVE